MKLKKRSTFLSIFTALITGSMILSNEVSAVRSEDFNRFSAIVKEKTGMQLSSQENHLRTMTQYSSLFEVDPTTVSNCFNSQQVDHQLDLMDLTPAEEILFHHSLKAEKEEKFRGILDKIFSEVVVAEDNARIPVSVYVFGLRLGETELNVRYAVEPVLALAPVLAARPEPAPAAWLAPELTWPAPVADPRPPAPATFKYTQSAHYYNRFAQLSLLNKQRVVFIVDAVNDVYEAEKASLDPDILRRAQESTEDTSEYAKIQKAIKYLEIPGGTAKLMPFTSQLVTLFRDLSDSPGESTTNCPNRLLRIVEESKDILDQRLKSMQGSQVDPNKLKTLFATSVNDASRFAIEEFGLNEEGQAHFLTPEMKIAAEYFLAQYGVNLSSIPEPESFSSYFDEMPDNIDIILDTVAERLLRLDLIAELMKSQFSEEERQSLILDYDKKFTLSSFCASFGIEQDSVMASIFLLDDLNDPDSNFKRTDLIDPDSREDIAQFVLGEKGLTVKELSTCSPLGKEGILFVSLIGRSKLPFYVDPQKLFDFDNPNPDPDEVNDIQNAGVLILKMMDEGILEPASTTVSPPTLTPIIRQTNGRPVTAIGQLVNFVGTYGYQGIGTPPEHQRDQTDTWMVVKINGRQAIIIKKNPIPVQMYNKAGRSEARYDQSDLKVSLVSWYPIVASKRIGGFTVSDHVRPVKLNGESQSTPFGRNLSDQSHYPTTVDPGGSDSFFVPSFIDVSPNMCDYVAVGKDVWTSFVSGSSNSGNQHPSYTHTWLRSPLRFHHDAAGVDTAGSVDYYLVYNHNLALRPACWVNI
jgi:hypothetical protein